MAQPSLEQRWVTGIDLDPHRLWPSWAQQAWCREEQLAYDVKPVVATAEGAIVLVPGHLRLERGHVSTRDVWWVGDDNIKTATAKVACSHAAVNQERLIARANATTLCVACSEIDCCWVDIDAYARGIAHATQKRQADCSTATPHIEDGKAAPILRAGGVVYRQDVLNELLSLRPWDEHGRTAL